MSLVRRSLLARLTGRRLVASSLGAVTGFVFLALYAPILLVAVLSFFRLRRGKILWDSFSFQWYAELLSNRQLAEALTSSLVVGFFSVLVTLVLATLMAFYTDRQDTRWTLALRFVIFLPFLLPPIITGLSLLVFFKEIGLSRGLITVIIGHSVFVLALVYQTILTRLQALSRTLVEASQDLGATRWQTVRFVLLPNLRMALVTASLLAFALSFDETMITLFLVGDNATLPVRLYAMMRVGFTPEINALVTLILLFSTLLTIGIARFVGRDAGAQVGL
ncbi:MAG: ABC transporter permease [Trueperaceae bacterium]|nr:MAG: ABC transporter permease [Trueperaceae bacterium]